MKHQRIMAFDFGTKFIGVGFGQMITQSAEGIARIQAKGGKPDWAQLDSLVAEWQPEAFVVGLPLNMDGSDSDMSFRAKKFANRIKDRFNKAVYLNDERLTSAEAKSLQNSEGQNKQTELDSLAAALILESWFRQQASTETNSHIEK